MASTPEAPAAPPLKGAPQTARQSRIPDAECERALQEVLRVEPALMRRAMSTLSSCAERPHLLAKYLPPIVEELKAAVADDPTLQRPLENALAAYAELEASGRTATAADPSDRS